VREKINFTIFLGVRTSLRESLFSDQRQPLRAKNLKRKTKQMKTTKKTLLLSLDYLSNVTGLKYNLSCQCSGSGKGYSVMHDGSHVLTFGHVPASTLEACIAAYVKGYLKGEGK
jgi:hypothetical protein